VFVAVVGCFPVELTGDEEDGVDDEAILGLAASINVIATAATAPNLPTMRIMTPTMVAAVSRNVTLNDDLTPDCASV
jgi:hypothetical protein